MNSNESIRTFGNAEKLDFSGKGLDSTDAKVLADLLKDNTTAQYLNVFGNQIPEDVLRAIMNSNESIRTFGNAEKLDFSGKGLDSTDAKVLADLLKDNTTAQYLDVSRMISQLLVPWLSLRC